MGISYERRLITDYYRMLNIKILKDAGYFNIGVYKKNGTLSWSRNEEITGVAEINMIRNDESGYIILNVVYYNEFQNRFVTRETIIDLVTTNCNYGGKRWWFICPHINIRCGILYMNDFTFRSRKSLNLIYYTQTVSNNKYRGFFSLYRSVYKKRILRKTIKVPFRNGKPTKKMRKVMKIGMLVNDSFNSGKFNFI